MLIKSYEVKKNIANLPKYNFFLLYGENIGLKKDVKEIIKKTIKQKETNLEILSFYENEIIENDENFYNFSLSGSLFGEKKIIIVFEGTDKIIKKINDIYIKSPQDVFFIILSNVLEKKSKLRSFFEKDDKTICIPCYPDTEKDLEFVAQLELKKENIILSREVINLLIEKSNFDRENLRNELEKIKSFSLNKKKIELDEIKSLINFSGDHKSDILVNECLCGNIHQYKKIISELYTNTINLVFVLRILNSKVQRLLKIKEEVKESSDIEKLINNCKPMIFWKEKPIVKKQLTIWSLDELRKMISEINSTEYLCKKRPQISKAIFFNLFLKICIQANSYS